MTDEKPQSEPKKLTPKELADKLDKLVDKASKLENSLNPEDSWARKAFIYSGYINLNYEDAKRLCPELFTQLIDPATELAHKKGEIYKLPKNSFNIILDKNSKGFYYDPNTDKIKIGIPSIRIRTDINELVSVISHEIWHRFQFYTISHIEEIWPGIKARINDPNSVAEYRDNSLKQVRELDADRLNNARTMIASNLSVLNNDKSYYNFDDSSKHRDPNFRQCIKVLLEEMMGNEVFGMNGVWREKPDSKGYHFQPVDIEKL